MRAGFATLLLVLVAAACSRVGAKDDTVSVAAPAAEAAAAPAPAPIAPAIEPPPLPPTQDLFNLLAKHAIEVEVTGSDIQSVEIRLRLAGAAVAPIRVEIPAGAFFKSSDSSEQNMIATTTETVTLSNREWTVTSLAAACASRPLGIPDGDDHFAVQRLPAQAELAKAAKALAKADAPYAVIQAAIWIISDDADFDDLGELVESVGFNPSGGTRVVNEEEAARALRILSDAGIDIKSKQIWNDRDEIVEGLKDKALKRWLADK